MSTQLSIHRILIYRMRTLSVFLCYGHTLRRESEALVKALIYTRVSSGEQGESKLGLEAQASKCSEYSAVNELEVLEVLAEVKSGKSVKARPVLNEALSRLKAGEAEVLVVAKLDRLSRSLFDFASLLQRSEREGWSVVILDLGISTTSPVGRLQAQIVASVAEF